LQEDAEAFEAALQPYVKKLVVFNQAEEELPTFSGEWCLGDNDEVRSLVTLLVVLIVSNIMVIEEIVAKEYH
jgi:hypothetical protein